MLLLFISLHEHYSFISREALLLIETKKDIHRNRKELRINFRILKLALFNIYNNKSPTQFFSQSIIINIYYIYSKQFYCIFLLLCNGCQYFLHRLCVLQMARSIRVCWKYFNFRLTILVTCLYTWLCFVSDWHDTKYVSLRLKKYILYRLPC